jgi:soluble lytic murein transglycosylase
MFNVRGTPIRVLGGGIATALIIAASVTLPPAQTAAGVDNLVTGAIGTAHPAASSAQLAPLPGTLMFRDALDLVAKRQAADAYVVAEALTDPVERLAIEWAAIYYGAGTIPYAKVQAFAAEAPEFASPSVFRTRVEQSLVKTKAADDVLIKTLGGSMPSMLDAKIALAKAYAATGKADRATAIARSIWVENYLDEGSEKKVLAGLGDLLTAKDHWARTEHLMMNDRATAVERMLPFLTPAQKTLAVARNAVSRNTANAKKLLDAVDPAYRTDPVYYFSRAQRARQFELWDDAIGYLDKGPATGIDAEDWWYERRLLIRKLLSVGDAARAYKVASGYTAGPEGRLVEARFHAGWIALSFLNDAKAAIPHFEAMAKLSTLADSVTQANFWLGRARSAAGDAAGAKAAYSVAAGFGTVYYGLLARHQLGLTPVELRAMPAWKNDEAVFNARPVVQAIRLLTADGRNDMAGILLRNLAQQLKSGGELVLAARLAQTIDAHHLAITIADIADKRGMPLDLFSFPKDGLPTTKLAEVDRAAVYAIARTESRFQTDAVSSSGARGLMQLMPATAKETAQKLGVDYSASRLTSDGAYNAQLGSSYLAAQLKSYGGSLLLAAAAYNAGAGNANKWITAYGDPRLDNVDPVVWVELIPFQETRKYVQRVLGNYLVYRERLGSAAINPVDALRHING